MTRTRAGEPAVAVPRLVVLAAILLLAAWLRVTGLTFGLPAVYNPDEVAILSRALAFAKGDLNPHNFLYPTFFFYALFGWVGGYFVLARLMGAVPSLDAFQVQFFVDPTNIYLAGRALGVACGVFGVLATWALARRVYGWSVALVAALFLATAPTAVLDAHYIKHDVPATLAITIAMLAICRVWPATELRAGTVVSQPGASSPASAASRDLVLAGAAVGVACSTHYYAVFLGLPLVIAIWHATEGRRPGSRMRALTQAGLAVVIVFVALSPFLLVEPSTAWQDVQANRHIVVDRSGAGTRGLFPSTWAYLRMLSVEAVGWPVALLAMWGTWATWRLSGRLAVWVLAFPVGFLLFISNTVAASRYLNPVLPFVALLAGFALHDLATRAMPGRRRQAVVLAAVLAALPGTLDSRHVGWFLRQDDTRTQAQRFIEAHLPAGSTVLLQPYSVPLTQTREGLLEALAANLGDPARASTKFALRLRLEPWPAPAYRTLYLGEGGMDPDKIYFAYRDFAGEAGADLLRRERVRYVVLKRYNVEDPATEPLRVTLERGGRLVARFSPYRPDAGRLNEETVAPFLHNTDTPIDRALDRPGPIMEIWTVE